MMKVVSSTIISAMPSTPSVKRAPQLGIQGRSIAACQPVSAGVKDHHTPSETTNSSRKNQNATWRAAGVSTPPSVVDSRAGISIRASAPTSGMMRSAGRTHPLYPIESRKLAMIRSSQGECAEHRQHTGDENPGVDADVSGLQPRSQPAESTRQRSTAVDEEAIDQAVVQQPPQEVSRHHVSRCDDRAVESFVDVILVRNHSLESLLGHRVTLPRHAVGLEPEQRE